MKTITEFLVNNHVNKVPKCDANYVLQNANNNCSKFKQGDYLCIKGINRYANWDGAKLYGKLMKTPANQSFDNLKFLYMITFKNDIYYFVTSGTIEDFDNDQFIKLNDEEARICSEIENNYYMNIQSQYSDLQPNITLYAGKVKNGNVVFFDKPIEKNDDDV